MRVTDVVNKMYSSSIPTCIFLLWYLHSNLREFRTKFVRTCFHTTALVAFCL